MTQRTINLGTADQGNGDPLRVAFGKVNDNFTELYTALGLVSGGLNLGAFEFTDSTMTTTDSSAIVIDQAVTVSSDLTVGGDLLPNANLGGDLGSPTRQWNSLYVSNSTIYLNNIPLALDESNNLTVNGSAVNAVGSVAWNAITGKPTFATVATSGSYSDLSGRPTIPTNTNQLTNGAGFITSTDRLSASGDEVVLTGGANPYTVFPAITGGDQLIIQGAEVSSVSGSLALTSQDNLNIIANGSGAAPGGSKSWTFGADGKLTFPVGNFNVKENAYDFSINTLGYDDETTLSWTFDRSGHFNVPLSIEFFNSAVGVNAVGTMYGQSEGMLIGAYPGKNVTIGANDGTSIWTFGTDGSLTIPSDIRSEGNINIDINLSDSTLRRWSFDEDGNLTLPGDIVFAGGGYIEDSEAFFVATDGGFQIQTNKTAGQKTWDFDNDGALELPTPNTVARAPNIKFGASTRILDTEFGFSVPGPAAGVVYTSSFTDPASAKLLITVEGLETGGDGFNHTQVCEMLVVRRVGATGATVVNEVVYGVTYTGTGALATFTAQENGFGGIDVLAQPTGTNTIYVRVNAIEVARDV